MQTKTKRASLAVQKKRTAQSSRHMLSELICHSEHSKLSGVSTLSDVELLKTVSQLRGTEKKIEISMLLYLIEVERRGLDLSSGYNSLFAFCTKHLKYSDSVAGRRIRAARCMRDFPAVYEYLSAGKVNVCNISLIAGIMTEKNHQALLDQISGRSMRYVIALVSRYKPATVIRDRVTAVKVFEKESVKADENESGIDSLGGQKFITSAGDKKSCTLFGLSTEGGSLGACGEADDPAPGSDPGPSAVHGESGRPPIIGRGPLEGSIRVKTVQKFKLQFAVSPEFMAKYEKIKMLMSTKHPGGMDFEPAFEALMDEYIEKHSPEARAKRREERETRREARAAKVKKVKSTPTDDRTAKAGENTISGSPAHAKGPATPAEGPGELCESPEQSRFIPQAIKDQVFKRDGGRCTYRSPDGRRCDSSWNLQFDHIVPFALGGNNSPENLQLLCRRHNQHKALKDFGKKKVRSHSKRG
ncbi:MAG: HNH endonuclease [Bacteroidales bacterium]|nr:HNH endonuclease [Candidatus Latescibacterota bacterium]